MCVLFFYYFNFGSNYDVLKSKSPCILLNKYINLNINERESKMENPTHSFRETNLVLQVISESQIKSKTTMSWNSQKKKESTFCTVYFVRRKFFSICVLSQYIVYWIHFQNIHTFTYEKNYFIHFCCFFFKSSKAFCVSLK